MKLKLFRCAVLCVLASSTPWSQAFAQDSVSITLGANNVQNGLTLKTPDGGATTAVTAGGSAARSTAPPAGQAGQFIYFATTPAFANNGSASNLWVTVEYFDEGTDAFRLEYDAQPDPNNPNPDVDAYTVSNGAVNNGLIYKYNSKQWLSYTFVLNNVYFGKRQPGESDFRINDWTVDNNGGPVDGGGPDIIRKVTVSKTEPTAFHIKYTSNPIKVDGVLDDAAWQSAQAFLLNSGAQDVIRPSKWTGTNDYSAMVRFTWDTNYLYAGFDTTDDLIRINLDQPGQAWNGDGAEIFFGFNQSNPARTAYIVDTDFHWCFSAGPNPIWELWQAAVIWADQAPYLAVNNLVVKDRLAGRPAGYVLEVRIPWALFVGPNGIANRIIPGQLVGFSIFGNDGDDPALPTQDKAFSLTMRPGPSYNPSSWATVQMDGPASTAPPQLSIAGTGANLTITFTGTLQSTTALPGTFTDVAGATNPYKVPLSGAAKFYRAVSR